MWANALSVARLDTTGANAASLAMSAEIAEI